mgnify:FL=1|jgi:hypothetical protein
MLMLETTMYGAYLGMALILAAFALETRGKISSRAPAYLWIMAIGQILLGIRAGVTQEWPFVALSIVWAGFAFYAIFFPNSAE